MPNVLRIFLVCLKHFVESMNKPLHKFFTNDHHRIDKLLDKATEQPDEINMEYYSSFRRGLLWHIKTEEKILFPQQKSG